MSIELEIGANNKPLATRANLKKLLASMRISLNMSGPNGAEGPCIEGLPASFGIGFSDAAINRLYLTAHEAGLMIARPRFKLMLLDLAHGD